MKISRRVRRAALSSLGVVLLGSPVDAGDGTIEFGAPDVNGVVSSAVVKTKVYMTTPRTQPQIAAFVEQMKVANRQLCDATDGRFRIGEVEFVSHPEDKDKADVWWMEGGGRASANVGNFGLGGLKNPNPADPNALANALEACFQKKQEGDPCDATVLRARCDDVTQTAPVDVGNGLGVIHLYEGETGHTIAHEFGHALFGIRDLYPNLAAKDARISGIRYYTGPGLHGVESVQDAYQGSNSGLTFYRPVIPGGYRSQEQFAHRMFASPPPVKVDGVTALYVQAAGFEWWQQNNSLMQQAQTQVCRRLSDNFSHHDLNPVLYGAVGCSSHSDCEDFKTTDPPLDTDFAYCGGLPVPMGWPAGGATNSHIASELTVAGNFELNRAGNTLGNPYAIAVSTASRIQPARHLVVQGFLRASAVQHPPNTGSLGGMEPPCPLDENGECEFSCPTTPGIGGSNLDELTCWTEGSREAVLCPMSVEWVSGGETGAFCGGCVPIQTEDCPQMPRGAGALDGTCGDGIIQFHLDPDRTIDASGEYPDDYGEQCDPGTGNFGQPYIMTDPIVQDEPLQCNQVFSTWRIKALLDDTIPAAEKENLGPLNPPIGLRGGLVYCNENCRWDLSRCSSVLAPEYNQLPKGDDSNLQLDEYRDASAISAFAEVFDSLGRVKLGEDERFRTLSVHSGLNLDEVGPSNHGVFVFLRKMYRYRPAGLDLDATDPIIGAIYRDVWELAIVMDAAEFGAGTPGVSKVVDRLQLEYEMDYDAGTGSLVAINGVELLPNQLTDDENTWPVAHIGFDTNPATPSDAFHDTAQAPTGLFTRGGVPSGSPGMSLRVDLRGLTPRLVTDSDGNDMDLGDNGGVVSAYARNDLINISSDPAVPKLVEVPQYADTRWANNVVAGSAQEDVLDFVDNFGYNETTKRFESSNGTLEPLKRNLFGEEGTAGYQDVCLTPGNTDCVMPVADMNALAASAPAFLSGSDGWGRLAATMCRRWGVDMEVPTTADAIEVDAPEAGSADCPDPNFLNSTGTDFDEETDVVFVLDRSGSMGIEDIVPAGGTKAGSRLDYVKVAAKSFARDILASSSTCVGGLYDSESCASFIDCTGGACIPYSECEGGTDPADTSCVANSDCSMGATCQPQPVGGARVGVMWYSDSSEDRVGGVDLGTCDALMDPHPACAEAKYTGACVCVDLDLATGTCAPTALGCQKALPKLVTSGTDAQNGLIGLETFDSNFATSTDFDEDPVAEGFTGSGAALLRASAFFKSDTRKKLLLHLTDGINNRPIPVAVPAPPTEFCRDGVTPFVDEQNCWPGTSAANKYNQAIVTMRTEAPAISLFQYPLLLGFASDPAAQAIEAGQLEGELFDVYRWYGEDTIPAFLDGYAASKGEQLVYDYENMPVVRSAGYGVTIDYDIPVEVGAKRLNVRVSDWNNLVLVDEETGVFRKVAGDFNPENYYLLEPDGVTYHGRIADQPRSDMTQQSLSFSIRNPAPGVWRLMDYSQQFFETSTYYRTAYVAAHVENPLPGCRVTPTSAVTDGVSPMAVTAQAYYQLPLVSGVNYTGKILGPDRVLRNLSFNVDPDSGVARALVPEEYLVGRGRYRVLVSCQATDTAQVAPGEGESEAEPLQPVPFTRQDSASFFMNVSELAPLPGINSDPQPEDALDGTSPTFAPGFPFVGDCDGDRIPNVFEYPLDVDEDNDGIPDACDPDANDNGIADGVDPDYGPANEDGDGIPSALDNCDTVDNVDQYDSDRDGYGDECDDNPDNDDIPSDEDNCPLVYNPDQLDTDDDGLGDKCEDVDGDGIFPPFDNCPNNANPDQTNSDNDSAGDECDNNDDNDAQSDANDNCPTVPNSSQLDADSDGIGDLCDVCPQDADPDQADMDGDGIGDACDSDPDDDGVENDNCPEDYNPDQKDTDGDGVGDECDPDPDDDGLTGEDDNCPYVDNASQTDSDSDGVGDVCDCGVATIEAEGMDATTGGAIPGGWNLWSNGSLSKDRELPGAPGTITVRARGEYAAGAWPHMIVFVGDQQVGDTFVDSGSWDDYSFDFDVDPGEYEIRIVFDNDYYRSWPPADRNLLLDYVTVECAVSCEDGLLNQDETGVDCGGSCGQTCWDGEDCSDSSDCISSPCNDGTCGGCTTPDCEVDGVFADAGDDQLLECGSGGSAMATLDGSGSGPASAILDYAWTAAVALTDADMEVATGTFPLGTHDVTLVVSDGPDSDSDVVTITVIDTVGPSMTAPPDVVASSCGSVVLGAATGVDSCGGPVTLVNDAPATFKAGLTVVTWTAIDQFGNTGTDTQLVEVGLGDDPNCCPDGVNVIVGTSNNDTLHGTPGADCIVALGAQDTVYGYGGNDVISGGDGDDVIYGGDGNDSLSGGTGQDQIRGENGNDLIFAGDGVDLCWGGANDDRLYGGQGQDSLYGEAGNDFLYGEGEDDRLEGASGDDYLEGGGLHDTCLGGSGSNTLVSCETIE